MRDIQEKAVQGDIPSQTALRVYCHSIKKYIGAYTTVMGGLDALVFTAGVGENLSLVRQQVCQRMSFLGLKSILLKIKCAVFPKNRMF